ncbi:MAG: hypothetical protein ABJH20_05165, partial [Rhizobiaceae bacterium]
FESPRPLQITKALHALRVSPSGHRAIRFMQLRVSVHAKDVNSSFGESSSGFGKVLGDRLRHGVEGSNI